MFYRCKILLAILETFPGQISENQCEKLVFAYCQISKKNYYDFFWVHRRKRSLVLAHDRQQLIKLGYLAASDGYRCIEQPSTMTSMLKQSEREYLRILEKTYRQVYAEQETEETSQETCLFTLGYEGVSIDAYLALLGRQHVRLLVDVRKNPYSRKYGFSMVALEKALMMVNIEYLHMPELGIEGALRRDIEGKEAYYRLFEYYSEKILPQQEQSLASLQKLIITKRRVALTCFEADPIACHRHRIVAFLQKQKDFSIPVYHLRFEKEHDITGKETQMVLPIS